MELEANNKGVECPQLFNEIIAGFDKVLTRGGCPVVQHSGMDSDVGAWHHCPGHFMGALHTCYR